MLLPETILQDRYRIVRQLGQGGMGAVYEALDQRLDTVVALKETLFSDERLRKQFEREARLLARLHHQALPRVSDHFNEGDGQFLVMQFIPGEDLFEMQARRNGPFPPADVLRWADQLCDALDYLHTQEPQIIHRDIKPQNLKLTARGQVILLDFGLAKGSGGPMSVVTTSASIFGYTPNYAPLEQVQGLGTDARSDIYSLAATLYHLLTNIKPPDALSRASAIVNGLPDPLALAHTVSPQVSAAVASVLDKAMSQKRDDRYASAEEMRQALKLAADQPAAEAATVLTSGGVATKANTVAPVAGTNMGGAQTNLRGNEAQTLVADEGTQVSSGASSPEIATLVRPATKQNRSRTWVMAAVVLILAGVVTAVLIRRALKSEAAAPTAQNPQPTPTATTTPAESVQSVTVESKTETPKPETANPRTKQPVTTTQPKSPDVSREPIDRRPPPEPPPIDPVRNPPDRQPPPRDEPRVRTFPNGTRVETRPDGTRIVTFPDGRTRVFPPGDRPRPNPRRRPN
jgi:eukaryotic-like serine/threonine-protein kinase